MSSLTNINNNASVVNVGRTTPVTPGVKPASQSIPVVIATDQPAIPVIEQQKIQSEVALSLLRALGLSTDEEIKRVFKGEPYASVINHSLEKDISKSQQEAYIEIYRKLRDGDLATADNAKDFITNLFCE